MKYVNESFLKMSKLLELEDVKNNKFMFEIINKNLEGVDPYDPDLSDELKKQILEECKNNPWYYFRNVVKLKEANSDNLLKFELNQINMPMIYNALNSINHFSNGPRCSTKDVSMILISDYLLLSKLIETEFIGDKLFYYNIKDNVIAYPEFVKECFKKLYKAPKSGYKLILVQDFNCDKFFKIYKYLKYKNDDYTYSYIFSANTSYVSDVEGFELVHWNNRFYDIDLQSIDNSKEKLFVNVVTIPQRSIDLINLLKEDKKVIDREIFMIQ